MDWPERRRGVEVTLAGCLTPVACWVMKYAASAELQKGEKQKSDQIQI